MSISSSLFADRETGCFANGCPSLFVVLKNRSLHCTHCHVTLKVLLLEISLQSQTYLFLILHLETDRQVVLQMVVQVCLLCLKTVLYIALIVKLPSKCCFCWRFLCPLKDVYFFFVCSQTGCLANGCASAFVVLEYRSLHCTSSV
jgi:hypothetical protein